MSTLGWIALAIVLASCVVLSVYNMIVSLYMACKTKSWLVASRAAYPFAIALACGFMLDRVQFKLTGVNGIDDILIVAVGIIVFLATVIRTVAIIVHKDKP